MYRIENIILLAAAVLASVYVASGDEEQKSTFPALRPGNLRNMTVLERMRSCMDRLDGHIESSQVVIHTLLKQLNVEAVFSGTGDDDNDDDVVKLVQIQTADDRGMLIWTTNGFYVSLSFILFLHLVVLIVFGVITLCLSKSPVAALPRMTV
ncbi:uncharacterized protein LOC135701514 [Ochlerotatus camptorhynchus]|uniref:uncharacterized protein LOC135701514 n=1 Tax=Ochlerotatus camptorhynchus TaxID=644619 RepID=UPI0031D3FB0D